MGLAQTINRMGAQSIRDARDVALIDAVFASLSTGTMGPPEVDYSYFNVPKHFQQENMIVLFGRQWVNPSSFCRHESKASARQWGIACFLRLLTTG